MPVPIFSPRDTGAILYPSREISRNRLLCPIQGLFKKTILVSIQYDSIKKPDQEHNNIAPILPMARSVLVMNSLITMQTSGQKMLQVATTIVERQYRLLGSHGGQQEKLKF